MDKEIIDRFYGEIRTQQVQFVINDPVRVTAGPNEGRTGSVVSVESLDQETTYLVEPGEEPWGDMIVGQSKLALV